MQLEFSADLPWLGRDVRPAQPPRAYAAELRWVLLGPLPKWLAVLPHGTAAREALRAHAPGRSLFANQGVADGLRFQQQPRILGFGGGFQADFHQQVVQPHTIHDRVLNAVQKPRRG